MHVEDEEDEKSGSGGDESTFESWAEDFRAKQRVKYKDYHEEKYEKNEKRFREAYKTSGKTLFIGIVAVAIVIAAAVLMLT
jgi:5-methylcytosine-specific restriction endonuclease McrBC GTP-binding regulatory subunit McrB